MSEPKWTPGPWETEAHPNAGFGFEIVTGDGTVIGATSARGVHEVERMKADATLWSVAPELCDALEQAAQSLAALGHDYDEAAATSQAWEIVALLAKARGESS